MGPRPPFFFFSPNFPDLALRPPRITIQNSRRTARARAHHSPVSDSLLVFCYRRGANRRAENIAVSRLHPPPASVAACVCARDAQGRRPAQSPGRGHLRRGPGRRRRLRQFLRRPYHLAIAGRQRATGGKVTSKLKKIGLRPAAALPENSAILQYVRAVDARLGVRSSLVFFF